MREGGWDWDRLGFAAKHASLLVVVREDDSAIKPRCISPQSCPSSNARKSKGLTTQEGHRITTWSKTRKKRRKSVNFSLPWNFSQLQSLSSVGRSSHLISESLNAQRWSFKLNKSRRRTAQSRAHFRNMAKAKKRNSIIATTALNQEDRESLESAVGSVLLWQKRISSESTGLFLQNGWMGPERADNFGASLYPWRLHQARDHHGDAATRVKVVHLVLLAWNLLLVTEFPVLLVLYWSPLSRSWSRSSDSATHKSRLEGWENDHLEH